MIDVKTMLCATAALTGLGLVGAGVVGYGSAGFVAAVVLALGNLVGLSVLVRFSVSAVKRGEPAAAGLAALYGKTLVMLGAVALLAASVGGEPVALGFALVMTSFTIAAPLIALMPDAQPLEAV